MKTKIQTITKHYVEDGGVRFEVPFATDEDVRVEVLKNGDVQVGFLVRDEDCSSPISEDYCNGSVAPVSRHGTLPLYSQPLRLGWNNDLTIGDGGTMIWIPCKDCLDDIIGSPNPEGRAVELCSSILAEYNAWAQGDNWGIGFFTYLPDGTMIQDESVWGFIGRPYAEEFLAEMFNAKE